MSTYVLWDVASSTLLLDTDDVGEARRSIDAFINDNSIVVLDELLLGIEHDDLVQSYRGSDILSGLGVSHRDSGARKVS